MKRRTTYLEHRDTGKHQRHTRHPLPWVIGAALVVGSAAVGSSAQGYFRATGTGAGNAGTGVTAVVSLSPGTGASDLLPGGTGQVTTVAQNTTATGLHLQSLALDTSRGTSGFAIDGPHSACGTTVFSFTTQTNGGNGWTAAANSSTTITLPGALALATSAASSCQGATVTVYLEAVQG